MTVANRNVVLCLQRGIKYRFKKLVLCRRRNVLVKEFGKISRISSATTFLAAASQKNPFYCSDFYHYTTCLQANFLIRRFNQKENRARAHFVLLFVIQQLCIPCQLVSVVTPHREVILTEIYAQVS